jgi:hypothetical protein
MDNQIHLKLTYNDKNYDLVMCRDDLFLTLKLKIQELLNTKDDIIIKMGFPAKTFDDEVYDAKSLNELKIFNDEILTVEVMNTSNYYNNIIIYFR